VELERVLALRGGDALEAGEEVDVPEGAAELAVGDRLQAGRLLQRDGRSDAPVFDLLQLLGGNLLVLMVRARLPER
jgi:hypothetical protein